MIFRLFAFMIFLSAAIACNDSTPQHDTNETEQTNESENFTPPPPGTVVAKASMPIKDELNDFTFTVKIVANEYTNRGTYTIQVNYGPNDSESMFTLPKGAAHLKPDIKKGEGYTYIIGFIYKEEFYDYYEVKATKGNTSVKNIKAYSFQ